MVIICACDKLDRGCKQCRSRLWTSQINCIKIRKGKIRIRLAEMNGLTLRIKMLQAIF